MLSDGHEHAVNEIVVRMKMAQSPVSKHLGALHRAVWSRSYNAASIACIDSTREPETGSRYQWTLWHDTVADADTK